jgi:hypothetical protein
MRAAAILALFAAATGAAACTSGYDNPGYYGGHPYGYGYGSGYVGQPYPYAGYHYTGYDYGPQYDRQGNQCQAFQGSGGDRLDPWLACTQEGQDFLRGRYDSDSDHRINDGTADEANIWFRRHADTDRDMQLTDAEIRAALVNAARFAQHGNGAPPPPAGSN